MSNNELPPGTLEMGSGEPILLLHGVMGTPIMWRTVLPYLAPRFRAIAPAALGHQGGRACTQRPVRIRDVVDDAQRTLDALGLPRAHLAGNSMGGWMALELARRGRALSVCAFSPAGMWGDSDSNRSRDRLKLVRSLSRQTRFMLPWIARYAIGRKLAMRDSATHGDRTAPADLIAMADAMLACDAAEDLLAVSERFEDLTVTCPTDVVWSGKDRIFPLDPFAETARNRIRGAHHWVLDGVGHVPMVDDPQGVARAILATVDRTEPQSIELSAKPPKNAKPKR